MILKHTQPIRATMVVAWMLLSSSSFAAVASGQTARYRVEINNTWSEETHPGRFPFEAHFSWFGGVTHNAEVSFWEEGRLASPGMAQMAETGFTTILLREADLAINAGTAHSKLDYPWWFCPDGTSATQCGETTVELDVDSDFPLVTLVSMLGPSPDWFVGVSGLSLRENGAWVDEVVVDLFPYDGGTRSANQFLLGGPITSPPDPITLIPSNRRHLIGSASLGTMRFTLVPEPGTLVMLGAGIGMMVVRPKRAARVNGRKERRIR